MKHISHQIYQDMHQVLPFSLIFRFYAQKLCHTSYRMSDEFATPSPAPVALTKKIEPSPPRFHIFTNTDVFASADTKNKLTQPRVPNISASNLEKIWSVHMRE